MTRTGTTELLAAPLGTVRAGRLSFVRGASQLKIGVDGSMEDLYHARFDGKVPDVHVEGDRVVVKYRPSLHVPHGEIVLSGRIPWRIEGRMGMSHVVAELEDVELTGFEIGGGASDIELRLPRPTTTVPIRFGGGASKLEVIRPAGVPVRVRVGSGASELTIDGFHLAAGGGAIDHRSPDYDAASER
ncbi:MAG TPA: hypothetical protein VF044_04570, partial [Actinomycetota bacterium]